MPDEVITDVATDNHIELTNDQKMQASFWDDKPVAQPQPEVKNEPVVDKPAPEEEEILDPNVWLKRELDVDDIAVLKSEREELKKLRQTPAEIKFADDQSKLIHELIRDGKRKEVREFLETQDKLETFSTANVDKDNAEDIIKLGISLKNKNLSKDEINFQYKEEYTVGKEPVQKATEDDDDFKERHDEWKEKAAKVEMKRVIAAKMLQPELEKLKSQIVLPDIKQSAPIEKEPTPEDLDKATKYKEAFLKSADDAVKNFSGFSVKVKDKDVEIPISYGLSAEEKTFIEGKIKNFAESGYNANELFAEQWVNKDGTINTSKMTEDLSRMYFSESAFQKFSSDSASQRLELYLKEKKQINLSDTRQQGDFAPNGNKTTHEQLQEKFWANN